MWPFPHGLRETLLGFRLRYEQAQQLLGDRGRLHIRARVRLRLRSSSILRPLSYAGPR
jgi:hypothetical protein